MAELPLGKSEGLISDSHHFCNHQGPDRHIKADADLAAQGPAATAV